MMAWAKFDDRYDDHPKVMAATHRDPLASSLHAQAITAAARRESDGLVDPYWLAAKVPDRRKREKALAVLVDLHLFEVLTAGEIVVKADKQGFEVTIGPFAEPRFVVHDYLDFNPSSAQLAEKRRKDLARKSARTPSGFHADSTRNPKGK